MSVMWSSRKVGRRGDRTLHLRYDAGDWTIVAVDGDKTTTLTVSPETMDQLVQEWPKIRADVGRGTEK